MSEFDYQFVKIPVDLFSADIQPAKFKLICFLIAKTRTNDETGVSACFLGYDKLAEYVGTSKGALIKDIKHLESLGVVEKIERAYRTKKSHQLCNGLRVVFSAIGGLPKRTAKGSLNDTPKGSLNDSPLPRERSLNDTPKGSLNDTPYNRFKYIDLNYNKGSLNDTSYKKSNTSYIATGDGAPVRSMPNENQQGGYGGEFMPETSDYNLVNAFFDNFENEKSFYQLGKYDKFFFLRPYRQFLDVFEDKFKAAAAWFKPRGVILQPVSYNSHFANEIIFEPKQQLNKGA